MIIDKNTGRNCGGKKPGTRWRSRVSLIFIRSAKTGNYLAKDKYKYMYVLGMYLSHLHSEVNRNYMKYKPSLLYWASGLVFAVVAIQVSVTDECRWYAAVVA